MTRACVATIFFISLSAKAAVTGNDLIELCAPAAGATANVACALYVRGFIDGNMNVEAKALADAVVAGIKLDTQRMKKQDFCVPPNATEAQLKNVMYLYLDLHPETRGRFAVILVDEALKQNYPCPAR